MHPASGGVFLLTVAESAVRGFGKRACHMVPLEIPKQKDIYFAYCQRTKIVREM